MTAVDALGGGLFNIVGKAHGGELRALALAPLVEEERGGDPRTTTGEMQCLSNEDTSK
jgi:hypothetical protein